MSRNRVRELLGAAGLGALLLHPVQGRAFETATMLQEAPSDTTTEFEVFLPPAHRSALDALLVSQVTPGSPKYHHWLTPAQYRARFGTDPAVMDAAAQELEAAGLHVVARHAHGLRVRGSIAAAEGAFKARMRVARFQDGHEILAADGKLVLSPALAAAHATIAAFSPTIRMQVHSLVEPADSTQPKVGAPGAGPYWFDDLKQAYKFPSYAALDGKGVRIGVLMAFGIHWRDLSAYFTHEKLAMPKVSEIDVDGGMPFNFYGSREVELDIEQSGGMAPGASIVHYNVPDLSDAHVEDALTEIVESNAVDIVTMSFGGGELNYTPAYTGGTDYTGYLTAQDVLFAQGAAEGITFIASSGDQGAYPTPAAACFQAGATKGCGGFNLSAEFPASSPHVTSVGGTNLVTTYDPANSQDLNSTYLRENAYFDHLKTDAFYFTPASDALWGSGGGVSFLFKQPIWQQGTGTGLSYRTVPDVAGHMGGCVKGNPNFYRCFPNRSSDVLLVGGRLYSVQGTSAAAPDFAGLVALRDQHEGGRAGLIAPLLYSMSAAQAAGTGPTIFREHVPGNNGFYKTQPGYDMVLGLGTVYGAAFCGLPQGPFAGAPQTPTNP